MATGEFHKMHGLGNDFVVIDARARAVEMPPARVRAIANRKLGIGCDQLIILKPSDRADLAMRIYNADGGEVEACGNASRCVVALLGRNISIETAGGMISGKLSDSGATIDMGEPKFEWQDIPLAFAMDSAAMPLAWEELASPMAVNVGNPHAIFFVADSNSVDLERLGPIIEHDAAFPERVNVNVASIENGEIKLRVWERGVGLTRACGTGACATAVAAIRQGKANSPVIVHLPGGKLTIDWAPGQPVIMSGSAIHVFKGQANWDDFG
ncbi:MAG: diaminopimelate epimerase [Sphingomonadaceae bacterium]|nr:diaminopimelate epimerase [Sphingomonadaceae bacterium]